MKNIIITLFIAMLFNTSLYALQEDISRDTSQSSQQQQQKPQESNETAVVLGSIANIFLNVGLLTQNPKNPMAVASLFANVINIIKEIVKGIPADRRASITSQDIESYLIAQCPDFKQQFEQRVVTAALSVQEKMT